MKKLACLLCLILTLCSCRHVIDTGASYTTIIPNTVVSSHEDYTVVSLDAEYSCVSFCSNSGEALHHFMDSNSNMEILDLNYAELAVDEPLLCCMFDDLVHTIRSSTSEYAPSLYQVNLLCDTDTCKNVRGITFFITLADSDIALLRADTVPVTYKTMQSAIYDCKCLKEFEEYMMIDTDWATRKVLL